MYSKKKINWEKILGNRKVEIAIAIVFLVIIGAVFFGVKHNQILNKQNISYSFLGTNKNGYVDYKDDTDLKIAKLVAKQVGKKVGLSDSQLKNVTDSDDADDIITGSTAEQIYLYEDDNSKYDTFANAISKVVILTYVNGKLVESYDNGIHLDTGNGLKNGDKITLKLSSTSDKYVIKDESYTFRVSGLKSVSSSSSSKSSSSKKSKPKVKSSSKSKTTTKSNYTDAEYALMGFLALDGQGIGNLEDNTNMNWSGSDGDYAIDFGAHSTEMIVGDDSVVVKYDESTGNGMGNKNAQKTYKKQELVKEYGKYKSRIDALLNAANASSSSVGSSSSSESSADSETYSIGGHTWRKENLYGTEVLISTDNEELFGEWYANAGLTDSQKQEYLQQERSILGD